jgi:hypothetical protein
MIKEQSIDISFINRIELRAHELFEQRGCAHGHDWDDWLEAEKQIIAHTSNIEKDCIRSERFYETSHQSRQLPSEMNVKKNHDNFIG